MSVLKFLCGLIPRDVPRTEPLSDAEMYLSPLEREGVQDSADAKLALCLIDERKSAGTPWWQS